MQYRPILLWYSVWYNIQWTLKALYAVVAFIYLFIYYWLLLLFIVYVLCCLVCLTCIFNLMPCCCFWDTKQNFVTVIIMTTNFLPYFVVICNIAMKLSKCPEDPVYISSWCFAWLVVFMYLDYLESSTEAKLQILCSELWKPQHMV